MEIEYEIILTVTLPGRVAHLVTCLATDASLTADPGVASSIPARSHTFMEIAYEIILLSFSTGSHSAVSNVSGNRCKFDCRSNVTSLIQARSHTFVEIDREIISTVILPPSAE